MAVTTANLIMGPATVYIGNYGATEPADTAVNAVPAASAWTDLGGTVDGAEWEVKQEYTNLEVDQLVDQVGARLTNRTSTVTINLAEVTLENLAYALNDGTTASGSGFKTYVPNFGTSATQPTYRALMLDGFAPNSKRRRIILRKCLSTEGTKLPYNKGDQTITPVTFSCFYVSSVIEPFKIIDEQ